MSSRKSVFGRIEIAQARRRRLRILLVAPASPMIGGQTIQAQRLLNGFAGSAEIEVQLQPINPTFFPRLQAVKYVRTVITQLKYLYDLLRGVPRSDVIHVFSASYLSFLLSPAPAILIAKLFRKPVLVNYRSGEAQDHLERWRRTAVPVLARADRLVVPSGYLVDVFSKFQLRARSILNSVDMKTFRFRERRPLGSVFLSNRNFEAHYNITCVLKAFAIIQQTDRDATLLIAGTGPLETELKELASLLKLRNVNFLGRIEPHEMPQCYDRADIYLNSPSIDNMPNSIIEAFACGLPVVTTNAGGIPYIVEHRKTGMLVDVGDHEALAEAALEVLDNPDLARTLIENARIECEKYSWDAVRDQWLEVYHELAGRKR